MSHITEQYFDDIARSIVESVQFDSSLKPAQDGYPFGRETADCLAHFLSLASSMGFETHNYDNYVGEVVFGTGKDFAILAHLDVVPAGSDWKYPPFGGVINDDVSDGGTAGRKIWGRGTMDDKGPAIATLYALKALKDTGFLPKRTIKLIVGCNEESGWACMEHYNKVAKMPEEGFSPDADFPVIYAEKGIFHFTAKFPLKNPPFTALNAGEKVNMVCDRAEAVLTNDALCALSNYQNDFAGTTFFVDGDKLTVKGKSAHGSTPDMGANALGAMLKFFSSLDGGVKRAYDVLFDDCLNLETMHDETGFLTMSPDIASFDGNNLFVTVDIRFPATHKKEEVENLLSAAGVEFVAGHGQAPLYNDPNDKLISTLLGIYNAFAGTNEQPIAIGGGTYARALKRGCAFGPAMEGDEATIHQPNEYVTFDRIKLMTKIYFEAIKALTE